MILFSSSDTALNESKQLDKLFDSMLEQRKALALYNDPYFDPNDAFYEDPPKSIEINKPAWDAVVDKAISRGVGDCAICMNANCCVPYRPLILLSCSHVFHYQCIETLERFWDRQSLGSYSCPVCRTGNYEKQVLDHRVLMRKFRPLN